MTNQSDTTFLFHDYETWGTDPKHDWPCQFAAIRTDMDFSAVDKPINWFCKIPNDYLPHPQACLVTGITPQQSLRDGYIEPDFVAKLHSQLSQANTCVVGYNSIRFDDEVSRFTLFRNFYEPYAREWQNGNSRWDIIDLVRACYALRPDGIRWPENDDGGVSFKLERLSAENELAHESAHDALSDVHATIGLAKLIKQAQPKLFDYAFQLRRKQAVLKRIDLHQLTPFIHVSSRFKSTQGCCAIMMPIGLHPTNKNAIIAVNLCEPIEPILAQTSDEIAARLYVKSSELADGELRPALKLIHINRCPFVAPLSTLSDERAEALDIDKTAALQRRETLLQQTGIVQKLIDVYEEESRDYAELDVDAGLYQEGFLDPSGKQWCEQVIESAPEQLDKLMTIAPTSAYQTRLFRYRARNYPHTLNEDELSRWQAYRQAKLVDQPSGNGLSLTTFMDQLNLLAEQYANDPNKLAILRALANYAQNL